MLQHVMIGDAAPALALLALRGPLLFFLTPAAALQWLAQSARLQAALAFVLRPRVSLAVWAFVLAAWHIPAAYDYALTHPIAHDLEHSSFFVVGLLAWTQLIDPARRKALGLSQKLGCAIAMGTFALALSSVLIFTGPLYPAYAHQDTRLFGLSPSPDQHLAGLVMLAGQLALLGLCSGFLLASARQARIPRTRRLLPELDQATFGASIAVSVSSGSRLSTSLEP
jgi:cytochrome c oxidase assembly factor CtaG